MAGYLLTEEAVVGLDSTTVAVVARVVVGLVGLEHWTVSWEALVVPVGVGRLDNTKNVREVVEQIYFGSSDRNWIHE